MAVLFNLLAYFVKFINDLSVFYGTFIVAEVFII